MSNGERPEPDHLARQHVLEEEGLEDSQAVRVVQNGECGAQLEIADTTLWVSMVRNVDEALRAAYQEGQRAGREELQHAIAADHDALRDRLQAAESRERKAVEEALEGEGCDAGEEQGVQAMTVRELVEFLQTVDQDLSVICDRHSDYQGQEMPEVIEALREGERWVKYYPHQWAERPTNVVQVLHFEGN